MVRPVTPLPRQKTRPPGHVLLPTAAIGGLSLALAAGLETLGFLKRGNAMIAEAVSRNGLETFPNHLPNGCIWLAAIGFPFGVAAAMLGTPGHARRTVIAISTMVLIGAWAPVLSLAAYAPNIAAPWIATFWSCVCSMVYATNHRMPADENTAQSP